MSACQVVDQQKSLCYQSMLRMSLLVLVVLMSGLAMMAQVQAADGQSSDETVVGRVTLAIGQGQITHDDGTEDQAHTGALIREGDQILTRSNGHVHIRFVDDGLVSVRPNSRLDIERYQYDAEHPEDSTIRFNLEEGVTRAVSGKGAKAARDRYRMNTPIAAIGVRGTDYILSASADRIRAFVNEGAIVVSAFSDQCLASALGPCNLTGVELKGGSNQVLELQRALKQPRLLQMEVDEALNSGLISSGQAPAAAETEETRTDPTPSKEDEPSAAGDSEQSHDVPDHSTGDSAEDVPDADVGDQVSSDPGESAGGSVTKSEFSVLAITSNNQLSVDSDGSDTPMKPDDLFLVPFADNGLLTSDLEQNQLVWGRWSDAPADAPDFVFPYSDAIDGRTVQVTSPRYALMRRNSAQQILNAGLGEVSFSLQNASAILTQNNGDESQMNVLAGALKINFEQGTFDTGLKLDSAATGGVDFFLTGDINEHGQMVGNTPSQQLLGATSLDGQEAAYLFQKRVEQGLVEGITLWGAQK